MLSRNSLDLIFCFFSRKGSKQAMAQTQQILERAKSVLIGNYARLPMVLERGQGSRVWDTDGREYLDLFAGFGGAILGHSHPALIAAATEQAGKLWHVGN